MLRKRFISNVSRYIYIQKIRDTYRKDGVKIGIIPLVKETNELKKLVDGIEILPAHAVEMEMDSGGENECVDGIQVCIKVWFLQNR